MGATLALLDAVNVASSVSSGFSIETIALASGYALWLVIWFFLPRPARSYILAHELTHARWGLLFGAKVNKLKVSHSGGSVSLSKTNLWIILAPYFFPFYTFIVIALWVVAGLCIRPVPFKPLWFFLIGFTWSFHACFTLHPALRTGRPSYHANHQLLQRVLADLTPQGRNQAILRRRKKFHQMPTGSESHSRYPWDQVPQPIGQSHP